MHTINEFFFFGYKQEFLYFLYLSSIFCGVFVLISKNPIISVLFLIGLFLSIAGYLIILGINFIGLSYLLVYVGAISILFLFILMLINVRISELSSDNSNSIPLAIVIGILFFYAIYEIFPYHKLLIIQLDDYYYYYNNNIIMYVTSKFWDGNLTENSHIISIGNIMYTSYYIWLLLTSLILLLAMVGTICLVIN